MVDFDDLFAYETQKIVRIRDRRLGFTFYFLLLLIACYVVGFQILYSNEHFKRKDVYGTGRITIQQPTKQCNPNKPDCYSDYSALQTLPYCENFQGHSDEVVPEFRQKCVYADQHSLTPFGMLEANMMVPTRIDSQVEHRGCYAGDDTCDNEFVLDADPQIIYVADIERYTVMFVHSYHRDTLKGNNGAMQGFFYECEQDDDSAMLAMQESIEGPKECKGTLVRKPIDCINDGCPWLKKDKEEKKSGFIATRSKRSERKLRNLQGTKRSSGRKHGNVSADSKLMNKTHSLETLETKASQGATTPIIWGQKVPWGALNTHQGSHYGNQHWISEHHQHEAHKDAGTPTLQRKPPSKEVFAIKDGDIFSIQKILDLCGLDLDRSFNLQGEPLRESGTVIEVEAIYENLVAWISTFGYMPVSYTYKFTQRPMEEMKTEMFAQAQPDFPQKRVIENRHGLYLQLKVSGQFGFFSIVYLLIMLTTALGLIGVATLLTDKLAIYAMKNKDEYRGCKYENTKEFEDSQDILGGLPGHG